MALGYGIYDADNHLYEALDAFTRHLPAERARDLYWVSNDRGHRHLVVDGRVLNYIPNPTFDPVAVAGALDRKKVEPLETRPEYRDREARLNRFDAQGIEAALMFPTLPAGLAQSVETNIALHVDLLWAYNRWLDDDWGFAHRDRIFATPLFTLSDCDEAVKMLDWAVGRGARAIMLASGPVWTAEGYCSPADPRFDPFWARCSDAGVLVAAHVTGSDYNRYSGDLTGHYQTRPFQNQLVDTIINAGRAISDFFTAMVWQGAFTRHPGLRVMSVENRADWVPGLLRLYRRFYRPGVIAEDPIDVFHRNVWITPHWHDPFDELALEVPVERWCAGSDWPHYDALADPTDFAKYLSSSLDDNQTRLVMRENLRGLLV
jgi:hypothetical protein